MFLFVLALLILVQGESFCPSANDFVVMGPSTLYNQGWSTRGSGGVATKAAFNLIGGSVEYDVDFSQTHENVNANIYTISPIFSGSFTQAAYCDGQKSGDAWCVEIDWIETNGNCGGATTLHTRPGTGNNGCTGWGCQISYNYNGAAKFHMKIAYANDGTITVFRNGVQMSQGQYNPGVQGEDTSALVRYYQQRGAVIYSSQWQGWVPTINGCSQSGGDLGSSFYSVSNLVINGAVVQGPKPTVCSGSSNPPPPQNNPVAPKSSPVAPKSNPVAPKSNPPPPSGGSSNCRIAGSNNNQYYYEVQAAEGASVSIKCSQGQTAQCSSSTWGDKTYFQCWPAGKCDSPNPTCASPVTCHIAGTNNNQYYYEVQSVSGASVSVKCSQGQTAQCSSSTWGDKTYFQCWPAGKCDSPNPTCSRSGARLEDQSSDSSPVIPGWGIALIVIGSVVVVAAIVGALVWSLKSSSAESV
jgi:hypothetical protein